MVYNFPSSAPVYVSSAARPWRGAIVVRDALPLPVVSLSR
jgi:hypothetical protein